MNVFSKSMVAALVLSTTAVSAQKFNLEWETKINNRGDVYQEINDDGSLLITSSTGKATVYDGKSGQSIWSGKFKELSTNIKEGDYQILRTGSQKLIVIDQKVGKDRTSCFDLKTGKELWSEVGGGSVVDEGFMYVPELNASLVIDDVAVGLKLGEKQVLRLVSMETGKTLWSIPNFKGFLGTYQYLPETKELVMINCPSKLISGILRGFKSQIMRVKVETGELVWETNAIGFVEKKLVTREPMVNLEVIGSNLFVTLSGLQVFDFATGQPKWSVAYDESLEKGKGKVFYGAFADPIIGDDAVYLVTGGASAGAKFISKYDINTGKELWKSDKISGVKAIPQIDVIGDRVVVQIGGLINVQEITKTKDATYYSSTYEFVGNYGLRALDSKTGQEAWKSEKFDKRATNYIIDNGKVFAASANTLYGFDLQSGKELFEAKHDKKVGKPRSIFEYKDNIVVICDNGLASYKKEAGTANYSTDKFKKLTYAFWQGENFFIQSEIKTTNKIAGVNLETGAIKGIAISKKSSAGTHKFGNGIDITQNGEYIFTYNKGKVAKYKVN
jgi:hypothetical protein